VLRPIRVQQPADRRGVRQREAERPREEHQSANGADGEREDVAGRAPAERNQAETDEQQCRRSHDQSIEAKPGERLRVKCGDLVEQTPRVAQEHDADQQIENDIAALRQSGKKIAEHRGWRCQEWKGRRDSITPTA